MALTVEKGFETDHTKGTFTFNEGRLTLLAGSEIEMGNQLKIQDGFEDAPAVAFGDDLDTGMWSPNNGEIAFSNDGITTVHFTGAIANLHGFVFAPQVFVEGQVLAVDALGNVVQVSPQSGPQGPKGDTGEQGLPGAKGDTGTQGIQGPKGDKGDTGSQGIQGIPGTKGDTGATGPKGDTGAKGDQGIAGPVGPKGDTGVTGERGLTGEQGPTGAQGERGLQGVPGVKGDTGSTGETGARGPQGEVGPKGDIGLTGNDGAVGPMGPKGETGATGETGPIGPKGDTGNQGPIGLTGPAGENGSDGVDGLPGAKGDTGDTGPQGPKGDTGEPGLPGVKGDKGDTGATGAFSGVLTQDLNAGSYKINGAPLTLQAGGRDALVMTKQTANGTDYTITSVKDQLHTSYIQAPGNSSSYLTLGQTVELLASSGSINMWPNYDGSGQNLPNDGSVNINGGLNVGNGLLVVDIFNSITTINNVDLLQFSNYGSISNDTWYAGNDGGLKLVTGANGRVNISLNGSTILYGLPNSAPTPGQTLVANGAKNLVWENPVTFIAPRVKVQTWSATMTLDWSNADEIRVTLAGNTTFSHSGASDGQTCSLVITQDSVGNRSATFGSDVKYGSLFQTFALSTAANKSDELGFKKNGSSYRAIAFHPGF